MQDFPLTDTAKTLYEVMQRIGKDWVKFKDIAGELGKSQLNYGDKEALESLRVMGLIEHQKQDTYAPSGYVNVYRLKK